MELSPLPTPMHLRREEIVTMWFKEHGEAERPVNVRDFFEHLVAKHGYPES